MQYVARVKFDDAVSGIPCVKAYFSVLNNYDATGIGHKKSGTSTIFFPIGINIGRAELKKDLGDIRLISLTTS